MKIKNKEKSFKEELINNRSNRGNLKLDVMNGILITLEEILEELKTLNKK